MSPSIIAAFLLSGFAGLMHEIIWSKLLAGLIGTTAHAQAAVLVVYMGGLALGSVLFGRQTDRAGRPLRTYMLLEIAIAAYCLCLPFIFTLAGAVYVGVAGYFFESAQLKFALRFALSLLTVLFPALCMGGTLPLLARRVIDRPSETRRRVAALYAVNNFGAVLGAAVAGFLTLPLLGIYPSLALASAANLAAGALVWPLARRETADPVREKEAPRRPPAAPAGRAPAAYTSTTYAATLLALALSGFAAMGYEVVFIRIIALAFGATTYSFTVMLMSFISGIGLGSLLVMRLRTQRPLWLLGLAQLVVAAAFAASTPLLERLAYFAGLVRIATHESAFGFSSYELGKALLCLLVLLVPTVCLGASFPLVAAVQARHPRHIGAQVGSTYAWSTLGNVLGILITTLVLLPTVGLLGAFHVNLALSALAGAVVLAVAHEAPAARRLAAAAAAAAVLAVYAAFGTAWPRPLLYAINHMNMNTGPDAAASADTRAAHPSASFAAWQRAYVLQPSQRLLHLEEEAHANVLAADLGGEIALIVNTKTDASTEGLDLETQLLLAHAPLFMQPQARNLLVIGYGSGITLGSALRHPIERADLVEISDGVLNVDFAFAAHNYGALSDPRVHVYLDDAQSFLRTVPRQYDVIISEPSNPWIAGIAGLFTVEFFEHARRKLAPGGVFALWFHEYDQSNESIALILRTLRSVFPYATLFHEQAYSDIVAIAAEHPIAVDFAALEDRFDAPEVRNDLARIGISNLAALLSHHAVSPARFAELIGVGPLNRVTHQRLEYAALRALFEGQNADLVESFNPLLQDASAATDVLLDRYIAYRAERGEPLRAAELEAAAAHMSTRGNNAEQIRAALLARAQRSTEGAAPALRAARGAAPPPAAAGYDESVLWGQRFAAEGDVANAVAFLRRALELRPDDIASALRLSDLLVAAGDLPAAGALLDAALGHHPENLQLLAQRPWIYIREGRFAAAREALLKLVARRDVPAANNMIGDLLAREGKAAEAEPYFERALAGRDPAAPGAARLSEVAALLASLLREQGDTDAARRIVERALRTDPQHPQLVELRDELGTSP